MVLLAEFAYTMQRHPSFPFIHATHERTLMWYLRLYGLDAMYWIFILEDRA